VAKFLHQALLACEDKSSQMSLIGCRSIGCIAAPSGHRGMSNISYRHHRFPPEIIQHALWLYFRFPLSYRNVEDLLAECGIGELRRDCNCGAPVTRAHGRSGMRAARQAFPPRDLVEENLYNALGNKVRCG
jgi:hypothetical protein